MSPQIQALDMQGYEIFNLGSSTTAGTAIPFPTLTDYTPTFGGFGTDPTGTVAQYLTIGPLVVAFVRMPNTGVSDDTIFTISAPVAAKTLTDAVWGTTGPFVDNSVASATPGRIEITSGSSTINCYTSMTAAAWTAANNKRVIWFTLIYPFQ